MWADRVIPIFAMVKSSLKCSVKASILGVISKFLKPEVIHLFCACFLADSILVNLKTALS